MKLDCLRYRLLRWGFGLLYNQLAWTYDAVAWLVSLGQWQTWTRCVLPFLRGSRVLELAHGTGNLLPELAAAGHRPTGFDLSPAMGRIAGRKLTRQGLAVPLTRGMAQILPFPAGTFDSAVSTFPAAFILDPLALSEVHRVLAPDGIFVVLPIAHLTGRGPLARALEWLYRVTGQRPERGFPIPPQFAAAGFRTELRWVELPGSQVVIFLLFPER